MSCPPETGPHYSNPPATKAVKLCSCPKDHPVLDHTTAGWHLPQRCYSAAGHVVSLVYLSSHLPTVAIIAPTCPAPDTWPSRTRCMPRPCHSRHRTGCANRLHQISRRAEITAPRPLAARIWCQHKNSAQPAARMRPYGRGGQPATPCLLWRFEPNFDSNGTRSTAELKLVPRFRYRAQGSWMQQFGT